MKSRATPLRRMASPNRRNIAELEKELMQLKEKEKMYWNMAKKVK